MLHTTIIRDMDSSKGCGLYVLAHISFHNILLTCSFPSACKLRMTWELENKRWLSCCF